MRNLVQALSRSLHRWARRQDGNVTIEFVIVVPFLLALLFASMDVGFTMLRQVMLDRSMDMAMRQVRLGDPAISTVDNLKEAVCNNAFGLPGCRNSITVEMLPIDTQNFAGLNTPTRCISTAQNITPMDTFTPGAGGNAQELMLLRICVESNPFIRLTGYLSSLPINSEGQYVLVTRGIFVNEPS